MIPFEAVLPTMFALNLFANGQWSRLDDMPPPTDLGQTWVEIGGEVYGARPDDLGPIGGGAGYTRVVTDGDHRVSALDELIAALAEAQPGEVVFVDPAGDYDCTTLVYAEQLVLEVPEGVTLASNRGQDGSRGAVIYSDAFQTAPLIRATGPNVRLTGLWVRGPDPKPRLDHHRRSFRADRGDDKVQHEYYYRFPCSKGIDSAFPGLEVDNCEVSGWSIAGIHLSGGDGHRVHHCYIHHNQYNGLGYGVCLGSAPAVVLIDQNLFNYNRHSIAATGMPGNAYEACNNVEIEASLSHMFDMHGGRDRGDGTDIAGAWLKVHHNTFRTDRVRALVVRGTPEEPSEVWGNWLFHAAPGDAAFMPWPMGGATNLDCRDNAYGRENPTVQ
jgi:hypothetical protein